MLEEAKRRDHRKIGAEMGLFAIDTEFVGPGMPLWLPKGTVLVEETGEAGQGNRIRRRLRPRPHAASGQGEMYKTSGHLPYTRRACFRR